MANISPDGRKVVTAERNGIVGVWDAATGKQLILLDGHEDQPHDARFSPDGKMIVSGGRDGTARTWNPETGAQIAVHKQHGGNYVDTVSFSPDGKWILSAGNGWLDVWNATSGKEFSATKVGPEDEGGFSIEARFTPDGKSIILMDDEGKPGKTYPIELPCRVSGADSAITQLAKRKCITSPSLTTYSLPSRRILPASLAPFSPPSAT